MTASRAEALASGLLVEPPSRVSWYLRLGLWWARRAAGKEPVVGRLLAHAPCTALTAGIFELGAAHGPPDLARRELAVARLVASATSGCAFCIDMNAAGHGEAGLTREEVGLLIELEIERRPASSRPRSPLRCGSASAIARSWCSPRPSRRSTTGRGSTTAWGSRLRGSSTTTRACCPQWASHDVGTEDAP